MANRQAPPRGSPPTNAPPRVSPPINAPQVAPMSPQGTKPDGKPTNKAVGPQQPAAPEPQPPPQVQLPPENTYPCGCAWPGTHKQDCMWSLWEQMSDNYQQTRELMSKFMSQTSKIQETAREGIQCECPAGCHGTDLGVAMGLQQMTGVTVPWGAAPLAASAGPPQQPQSYSVESEARRQMEEQRRIKSTYVQFLNIFDMALDMANEVSRDRWQQNRRRKERQLLERELRLEELRKERLERQKGTKPEPPPEKKKTADKKDEKAKEVKDQNKTKDDQPKEDKPKAPTDEKTKAQTDDNSKTSAQDKPKTSEESSKDEPEPADRDEVATVVEPDPTVKEPDPTVEVTERPKEEDAINKE